MRAKRFMRPVWCKRSPKKVRYPRAALAWIVGAKQIAKLGRALYIYRCPACGGWHLTSNGAYDGSIKIDTAAAPPKEAA